MSAENEYQPINCDDYDNLELACQHHMVLEVTLQGGDVLTGKATDLVLRGYGGGGGDPSAGGGFCAGV